MVDRPGEVASGETQSAGGASPTPTSAQMETTAEQAIPETIDSYKILEILGEGGMGVVYRAQQTKPVKREVALKLIKLGMDTKQVIARFESERQALALMDHPNVAKVFDAGATEQGRPYFVMELVHGLPFTQHCDRHKLSIDQRLDLFMKTCEAIQHAHQKGIIHRDIKPGNILVEYAGGNANPKIIDFGVAKAISQRLTEKTVFTEQGQMVGTPAYMSPEQADLSTQDIDRRSDVYSLGMLLYELLTGMLPFDPKSLRSAGFVEIQRIIRDEEPQKPSTRMSTAGAETSGDENATITLNAAATKRKSDVRTLIKRIRGDLDCIVMKCLEKDRNRRYDTPNALAMELRRFLAGEPIEAKRGNTPYLIKKTLRKYRVHLLIVFVATVLLTICLSLISGLMAHRRARLASDAWVEVVSLEMEHRYAGALAKLRELEEVHDSINDEKIFDRRIILISKSARSEQVLDELRTLLSNNPESASVHVLLARFLQDTDPKGALKHTQEARRLGITSNEDLFLQALAMTDLNERCALLSQVIESKPDNFEALMEQAVCLYNLKRSKDMLDVAKRALTLRPLDARTHFNVAIAYQSLEQWENARREYERTVTLAPTFFKGWLNLGLVLEKTLNLNGAEAAFQRARELQPTDPRPLEMLAKIHDAMGNLEQALDLYQKLSALKTKNVNWPLRLSNTARRLEQWGKALAAANEAIQRDPDASRAIHTLAWLLFMVPEEAGRDVNRGLQLALQLKESNPSEPGIYNTLALGYYRGGDAEAGLRAAEKSIGRGQESAIDLLVLAMCQLKSGRNHEAVASYRKARDSMDLSESPPSPDAVQLRHELEILLETD